MVRLCGILFSRWTQGALFALILAATLLHDRTMWIITASVVGAACIGMLAVFITAMYDARKAWRKFPHTPQYRDYARKREAERASEDNKNKITLK